jgi:hypothetical protein
MSAKLNAAEILPVLEAAIEADISFQINFHNMFGLETAIEACEKIAGRAHDAVHINQQSSCFVISTDAGKGEVTFFVSKATAMPAETPFD